MLEDAITVNAVGSPLECGVRALRSRVDDLQTHCWPVNKAALRDVLPWGNERFTSRACPTLCPVPVSEVLRRNQSNKFSDLTGARVDALTVVGLIEYRGVGESLWAVRCACGMHERRQWKNLTKAAKTGRRAACHYCMTERPNVAFSGVPAGHSSNHPAGGTSAETQG